MLGRLVAAAVFVAGTVSAQEAREPVDLELVLLADASGSIDDVETRLQRQGYAEAMGDPQVLWAIALRKSPRAAGSARSEPTLLAPADSPKIVTTSGLPPNAPML